MENLPQDELFNIGINILWFTGETKHHTTTALLLFRIFNCCVITLTFAYVILNFFRVTEEFYVKTLQASISWLHLFLKYILLMLYKADIEDLLTDVIMKFWDHRKSSADVRKDIERDIRIVKYIQITIATSMMFLVVLYILRSIFTNFSFLLETAVPNSDAVAAILLLCQYHCFYLSVTVVFSYDLIYLGICARISLQTKLFKRRLKEVLASCDESTKLEMKKCIKHHQLLLKVFSRARNVYSVMLLFHYFVTIVTVCSDLFELLTTQAGLSDSIVKLISVFVLTGEFAYYAIPAEEVAFQFSDVPNAIYASDWYRNDLRTRKTILYIMTNSLRVNYFSGLGLMDINVNAFGSVLRKTFSFYTILRNLLRK